MTPDEQALRNIPQRLIDAWNVYDAKAFAAPFAENAVFIHIYGGQLDGRAAIEEGHRFIFDGVYKGSTNSATVREVRFLRPDVALVLWEGHLRFQGGDIHARPTALATKENGEWVIQAFQNTRITELPGGPPPQKP